tara:strand:+ start:4965 stop:5210 length:246 start_codon:yes stop_codon:yes gene_type:complete
MRKPIYRVIVDFEYRNNGRSNYIKTQIKNDTIDTFALSKDKDEVYDHVKNKILRKIGKKEEEIQLKITNIEVEGQYGETNY